MSEEIINETANGEIEYVLRKRDGIEYLNLWGTDDGVAHLNRRDAVKLIKTLCDELKITDSVIEELRS